MRKIAVLTLASVLVVGNAVADQTSDQLKEEAKGVIQTYFGQLKGELQAAMKAGGPVNAIEVCNTRAPTIAHDVSGQSGWQVSRTSLKLRNQGNAPDAWELAVLKKFEERKAAGQDPKSIAFAEVVEQDGGKTFRFMKAIPTGKVCLNCHGADLKPEVAAKLDEMYAKDNARGFKAGDLRGAFTLSKSL